MFRRLMRRLRTSSARAAEAEVAFASIRLDEPARGQARPARAEPERVAAHAATLAGWGADGIELVEARVVVPRLVLPVGDPFADIAAHVVKAEAVRHERSHRRGVAELVVVANPDRRIGLINVGVAHFGGVAIRLVRK